MRALARQVQRYPIAIVAVTMLATFALSWGIPRVEFQTGQDTLLDPGSKLARDNARFQSQFGGDPMLVLFEAPDGGHILDLIADPEDRARLERLEQDLLATGNYHSIISPLTVIRYAMDRVEQRMVTEPQRLAQRQDEAAAAARAESAARGESPEQQDAAAAEAAQRVAEDFQRQFGPDAERFLAIQDRTIDNRAYLDFILYAPDGSIRPDIAGVFPDDRHALMVVRLRGNLSIDEGSRVAADVKERTAQYDFTHATPVASGPPLLIKEINDSMRDAMVVMAIFAVAIMLVVLSLVFRARWRLLSLPAVLVGCVAAFGLMGFLGIPLTMVTISGLPILIGLGVDFAIQVHSRIEEETFASESAEWGIERTFVRLGPALTIAVVAACLGFVVLQLSDVPMIRDFGSMLAVGTVIVFAVSVALIASIIFVRERTRLGPREQPRTRIEVERLVNGLTSRTVGRLAPIAAIALVVAVTGLWLSRDIQTETDPERFVPSDSVVLKDLHRVRDVAGSTSELNLLVESSEPGGVLSQDVLDWMLAFEEAQKARYPALSRSNSLASFTLLATGEEPTARSAGEALASAPPALVANVVNDDRSMASITFAIGDDASLAERREMTNEIIASANPPPGVAVAPAGIAVVGSASVDALSSNRELMSFVAVGAILLALLLMFRNLVKAIAPMLPVVFALGASSMIIYVGGIEYSPLTSISGPLIIAMATEFNVLLMSRYFEERAAGVPARESMSLASLRIGRAITASGLTVMGGFAVLAFSEFPLLGNFGTVTALNIAIALFATLILLPPLLVWADGDHGFAGVAADKHPEPASRT